ncbi:MAG: hypothetical protein FWG10_01650 [Eubacteriaceae bacterium]|nr:hypothetical protein [Eubacteriaceae bacterium]
MSKICFLCTIVLLAGVFSACGKIEITKNQTEQQTPTPTGIQISAPAEEQTQLPSTEAAAISLDGTYWKAVEIIHGEEMGTDEFWSDLFLWESGTGYFRVSQATADSGYWGMRDVFDCGWSHIDGSLVLTKPESPSTVICTGTLEQNRLVISYDGLLGPDDPLTINMEQAETPSYGTQWEIPELYGTWHMVSYTGIDSGNHATGEQDEFIASEITIHPVAGASFWLASDYFNVEIEYDLGMAYKEGAIWEGCENEAWHVELIGNKDENDHFYVAFADGKLLLKKTNANTISERESPLLYTAEYVYIDDRYDYELSEWEGVWMRDADEWGNAVIAITNSTGYSFDFSFDGYYTNNEGSVHFGGFEGSADFSSFNYTFYTYEGKSNGETEMVRFALHDGKLLVSAYYSPGVDLRAFINGVYMK